MNVIETVQIYGYREALSRRISALGSWCGRKAPAWLKRAVLIDAGVRHIEHHEVVTDVPFTVVLQRAYVAKGAE